MTTHAPQRPEPLRSPHPRDALVAVIVYRDGTSVVYRAGHVTETLHPDFVQLLTTAIAKVTP